VTEEFIERGKIDIGRVVQQTFGVLGRNFVPFFLMSLLLVGLPSAFVGYVQLSSATTGGIPGFNAAALYGSLVNMVTSSILQGALIYGTVQDQNGARATIGESLTTGLRAFLPLIGLSILLSLGIAFGFVLLFVPGLMLLCAWCVAVPVLIAERRGVFECFGRSAELTRGNRWTIFALFVIVLVVFIVIGAVLGVTLGVSAFVTGSITGFNPIAVGVQGLTSTLSGMVGATGASVLYVELRRAREGAGPGWLADIFS
jgi:hypothetical protein